MKLPSRFPATIRARVHTDAIDRVTRFYPNRLSDIFCELLQNGRRSHATRIDVIAHAVPELGNRITVTDDGDGIPNPAVLLAFGKSCWDDDTARREDPAGMGLYALSREGCTIASRPRAASETELLPGWHAALPPAAFLGKEDVAIHECDMPFRNGTSVSFLTQRPLDTIRAELREAARYYPLTVTFDDTFVDQEHFLQDALHRETWRGIEFGVFKDKLRGFRAPELNFHGLTVAIQLPTVAMIDGETWTARADVRACPDLELVLPARKEAVESPFLQEMRTAARHAIYRAIAAAAPTSRVAYKDYADAAAAGIIIAVPPAELRPWRPNVADTNDWRDPPRFTPVGVDSIVIAADLHAPDAQAFWRAAERAELNQNLFEADSRLAGYDWYDSLATAHDVTFHVTCAGTTQPLDALRQGTETPRASNIEQRPDAIHVRLPIRRGAVPVRCLSVPADLAFFADEYCELEDTAPIVTAASAIQPHVLAHIMADAFFYPSDDCEADSYETQKTRFDDDAMHLALRLLSSEDDAKKHTIAETMHREVLWAVPRDREVRITVNDRKVDIQFGPPLTANEGAAA